MSDVTPAQSATGSARYVTHEALAKCGRVLCAFSHFYLPFYGQNPRDLFWHFDPFAVISASLYDVDEDIERGREPEDALGGLSELLAYLKTRITVDPYIARLFDDARGYYRFEHAVTRRHMAFSIHDLVSMAMVRSFDFRIMHRVLAQTTTLGYRESLFDWFRAFELLMEIDDDIRSELEDECRNTFNILTLAKRCTPRSASDFVEDLRRQAEKDVNARRMVLSGTDSMLCERVVELYREIVPRPPLAYP